MIDDLVGVLAFQAVIGTQFIGLERRASFELLQKALMAGIPIVAAVGAPSSLAVEIAQSFELTLIGFLRGDQFNVYSGAFRLRKLPDLVSSVGAGY